MLEPLDAAAILAVDDFANVARGFCSWCEGDADAAARDSSAASWLCKLYFTALKLPQREAENEEGLPEIPVESLAKAVASLSGFNGWYYREYFDPDPTLSDDAVMGDVGDDMQDIYKDIRRGLLVYDRGDPIDALWHWEFQFRIHWGRHAVGAIFALHCMSISKFDTA